MCLMERGWSTHDLKLYYVEGPDTKRSTSFMMRRNPSKLNRTPFRNEIGTMKLKYHHKVQEIQTCKTARLLLPRAREIYLVYNQEVVSDGCRYLIGHIYRTLVFENIHHHRHSQRSLKNLPRTQPLKPPAKFERPITRALHLCGPY